MFFPLIFNKIYCDLFFKKGKGLFFKKNFDVFVKLLQKSLQIDELSAYISFTLLIISKIEHEHRPKAYHSSKFSSGIEVLFYKTPFNAFIILTKTIANRLLFRYPEPYLRLPRPKPLHKRREALRYALHLQKIPPYLSFIRKFRPFSGLVPLKSFYKRLFRSFNTEIIHCHSMQNTFPCCD